MAAESLADFWPPKTPPERVHELVGALSGTFSVDLKQPFRLLFTAPEVIDDEDMLTRWKSIKKIEVLRIQDTHG